MRAWAHQEERGLLAPGSGQKMAGRAPTSDRPRLFGSAATYHHSAPTPEPGPSICTDRERYSADLSAHGSRGRRNSRPRAHVGEHFVAATASRLTACTCCAWCSRVHPVRVHSHLMTSCKGPWVEHRCSSTRVIVDHTFDRRGTGCAEVATLK